MENRPIMRIVINGVVYYYAYPLGLYTAFRLPVHNLIGELVLMAENGYQAILDLVCEMDGVPVIEEYVRRNYIIMSMQDLLLMQGREYLLQCINEDNGVWQYFFPINIIDLN